MVPASPLPNLGSYTLSAGELSSDAMPPASGRHSRSSGTQSPPASIPYAATVPRSHRYNPIVIHPTRATKGAHKRRISRSNNDTDEEDEEFHRRPWSVVALTREHLGLLQFMINPLALLQAPRDHLQAAHRVGATKT